MLTEPVTRNPCYDSNRRRGGVRESADYLPFRACLGCSFAFPTPSPSRIAIHRYDACNVGAGEDDPRQAMTAWNSPFNSRPAPCLTAIQYATWPSKTSCGLPTAAWSRCASIRQDRAFLAIRRLF
jgi:hypothetical protein